MHEFVDQTFQPETTGEKILSIQASLNGFSFSIVCPKQKKLLYFKDISLKISNSNLLGRHFESLFTEETILQNSFEQIIPIYHSQNFTLVPEQFCHEQIDREITPLLFEENDQLSWIHNKINPIKAELIFALPASFKEALRKRWHLAQVIHPLQRLIGRDSETEYEHRLQLLFENNHFSLALYSHNTLKLINNFSFKHPNDVVYFILTVLRQFNISAKSVATSYAGNLQAHAGLEALLQKHFPQALPINADIAIPPFINEALITKNISLFL
ncbi:DUF3822 family protein [uncultured Draconibacterium sp.]|uniref:DUF3822 family protein n=1 Tax=uncultured Draconibacterium sp. TaxID=1573823 RepID=UPI002AA6AF28|nr:DUF3822 family protein [uncultured Draconibacterium sp.]